MPAPRSVYLPLAGHEIHLTEWGDPDSPALIMWHGLARTGRDFDEIAAALSANHFVLCPDTTGRGLSSWAKDPLADYSYTAFGDVALAMLDHYGIRNTRWLGTSMGGLLGITLAGGRMKGRLSHLVINDAGPEIPGEAITRIADYVGSPPVFDTMAGFEAWLRRAYAPFGRNTGTFWRRMAETSARRTDAGRITVHYDPRIALPLTHHRTDLDVWDAYDAVVARTLLIRGEASDVLSPAVAEAMTRRGPRPELVTVAGRGHAPTLTTEHEIGLLRKFFARSG